jgi:hypothetical protein
MVERFLKSFKGKYLDLVILFFFPLAQVFINSNWIFNPIKALPSLPFQDTWFYNGNFFYFFDYVSRGVGSTHYFVERLPVNIPGYFLYHIFSPLKANYILHLGYYYIAIFSIYIILRILFNKRSALIASLAMGSYPWFLRAVGWDYVDGAGIAYYCLSMALMVLASKQYHWRTLLFSAGIATACLIYINLFWIPFALLLILFYITLNHLCQRRSLLWSGLFFGGGGLTITAFFSAFFYLASGRFLFFESSIKAIFNLSNSSRLTPLIDAMYSPMEPYWLILPVLFLISAFFLLASRKLNLKKTFYTIQFVLLIHFCLFFGFLIFWHIFFQPYLRIFLYMSYIIPATFLLFGALISNSLTELTDRQYYSIIILCVAIFISPLALTLSSEYFYTFANIQDNAVLLAIGCSILASFLLAQYRFSVPFACVAIAVIGFIGGADTNVYVQDRLKGRDNFVAVVSAIQAIDEIYPGDGRDLVFLYDNYNFDIPGVGVGGIYLDMWGNDYKEDGSFSWDWATITSSNNREILLIAQKRDAYESFDELLSKNYPPGIVQLSLQKHVPIKSGKVRFHLFLFHLTVQEQDHLYPGETFEFDRPFDGKNFYPLEYVQRVTYAWSGPETESEIRFKLGTLEKNAELSICVNATLQPEILDSFQLYVNNVFIPTVRSSDTDCYSLYSGTIPKEIINKHLSDKTVFSFRISKTVSPHELGINIDGRALGLSFDWIKIK